MKKTIMLLGLLVLCLIIIGSIIYVSGRSIKKDNQDQTMTNNTTVPAGDLQITTVAEGKGDVTVAGDIVSVNYTGAFTNGKVFDSNVQASFGHVEPLKFTLGTGQVIPGWDKGVTGMKVGEKRHLVIPSSLAYGPNDYGPIPGNSTLVFDVELLSFTHNK